MVDDLLVGRLAAMVAEVCERRARFVMTHPPVPAGYQRVPVRRETRNDCACHGLGVRVAAADHILTATECECVRWITRDIPTPERPMNQ